MECLRQRLKDDFGVTRSVEDDGYDFLNYVTVRWRGRLLLREKWVRASENEICAFFLIIATCV